jgi:hypothetical protein
MTMTDTGTRTRTSTPILRTRHELDALTTAIVNAGIDADITGLVGLTQASRAAGLSETLIAVLLDPTEPAPARERAFAILARRLDLA